MSQVRSSTLNREEKTFEIVFSTGAEVKRYGWYDDYYESLSMEEGHVNLKRLNNSAPFLKNHRGHDIDNVLGVIVPGTARIEDGKGIAKVQLTKREDKQEYINGIMQDIEDGVLPNVSVGYDVNEYEDISELDERQRVTKRKYRAIDWEPMEVSLVPMPADDDAMVRGQDENDFTQKVAIRNYKSMPPELDPKKREVPPATPPVDTAEIEKRAAEKARHESAIATKARIKEIVTICRESGIEDKQRDEWCYESDITVEEVRTAAYRALVERSKATPKQDSHIEMDGQDATVTMRDAMENAILYRAGKGRGKKLTDAAKQYRYASLLDIAKICVRNSVDGGNPDLMSKTALAQRAMHGTSDFAALMENIMTKSLQDGYTLEPQTHKPLTSFRQAPDFKEMSIVQVSDVGDFKERNEHGEYEESTMTDGKETYKLRSFGRSLLFTRHAIINDDLNALVDAPAKFGRKAAILEGNLAWDTLLDPTLLMGDGNALFHADHNNLSDTNDAISIASINKGKVAMRTQTDIDKETDIYIPVSYIITPIALETHVMGVLGLLIRPGTQAPDDYVIFAEGGPQRLKIIIDRRLDKRSTVSWYLASDPAYVGLIEVATLDGEEGPMVTVHQDRKKDGICIVASYDIAAKMKDWRGVYKNGGA